MNDQDLKLVVAALIDALAVARIRQGEGADQLLMKAFGGARRHLRKGQPLSKGHYELVKPVLVRAIGSESSAVEGVLSLFKPAEA